MPTSATHTYNQQKLEPYINPEEAKAIHAKFPAGVLNIPKGTILGEVSASLGTFKPYASGNVDGSQNPKAIAMYDMQIDANGKVTYSATSGQVGGEQGEQFLTAPVWVMGQFHTTDLTGLDATALTNNPGWRLLQGTVANGILHIG